MRNRRWLLLALPLLLAVALAAGYARLAPRLAAFAPEAGAADLAPQTAVALEFSQPMEPGSVEERFSASPEVSGELEWTDERRLTFTPASPWPRGTQVTIRLAAGARSTLGLRLGDGYSWQFTIRRVQLAYLWPADGPAQVYALDMESGNVRQLTAGSAVLDFDAAADGEHIYYAARNGRGGADLYVVQRATESSAMLLDCGADLCAGVQVSPDGGWLAYTRLLDRGGLSSEALEVWLLDLNSGETQRISPEDGRARLPQWSPLGGLLYYDADDLAYQLMGTDGAALARFPNGTGEQGAWSPEGEFFVAPELFVQLTETLQGPIGELANQPDDPENEDRVQVLTSHLLRYPADGGAYRDLTLADVLEDTAPAWSPDGLWLAFARRYLDEDRFTTGRQVWLMRPDGSELRALTNSPENRHAALVWHPEGTWLAAVRFNAAALTLPPEIVLIQPGTGEVLQLVSNAYSPQWLP
ncbi:MAG: PD40 domain-containing protein [Chloroflexi bacterium]|nr:PD40 domain-containing protein [Chloroflexota bacterium]